MTASLTARTARADIAINEIIRRAKAQSTGTFTTVERAGDADIHWFGVEENWAVLCEAHDQFIGVDARFDACLFGAHPERFCTECAIIVAAAVVTVAA